MEDAQKAAITIVLLSVPGRHILCSRQLTCKDQPLIKSLVEQIFSILTGVQAVNVIDTAISAAMAVNSASSALVVLCNSCKTASSSEFYEVYPVADAIILPQPHYEAHCREELCRLVSALLTFSSSDLNKDGICITPGLEVDRGLRANLARNVVLTGPAWTADLEEYLQECLPPKTASSPLALASSTEFAETNNSQAAQIQASPRFLSQHRASQFSDGIKKQVFCRLAGSFGLVWYGVGLEEWCFK